MDATPLSSRAARALLLSSLLWLSPSQVLAQDSLTSGDPGRNVNLIGPTRDPGDIRDTGLKQQNEPACAVRPTNPGCVICAFNDYRTVTNPVDGLGNPIIGDAWQGVSTSCSVGTGDIWLSRIAPGSAADELQYRVDGNFAADPRLIALPGMALFNFITGFRDDNRGTLALQHWLEVNREDADPYEPAAQTQIIDLGTDGRFIDKPEMLALLAPANSQGSVTLSFPMENPALGTITRSFPTGDLLFAYAVFTGSGTGGPNSVKVLVKSCDNWGFNCPNQATKLSEDQNLVSGITMTAIGNTVMAAWRRRGDNNEPDAIMWAVSNNRGKKWTKAEALPLCTFDMASFTSGEYVTFRTNDFPWLANDGKNFYLFYSDRSFDGQGSCTAGRPRIVMRHVAPGGNVQWSPAQALDNSTSPLGNGEPAAGEGLQFMPTAFGARGKVQVAWYDTRREALPALPAPGSPNALYRDQFVADYVQTNGFRTVVNRKLDVYTARVVSDASGNNIQVSKPVRVTRFRLAAESESGEIETPAREGEASFSGIKAYDSGTKAFVGDYIAMAAPEFRLRADGKWEQNSAPLVDPLTDLVDFFAAWTSQRDMRGEILPETLDFATPFDTAAAGGAARNEGDVLADEEEVLLAFGSPPDPPRDLPRDISKTTEGIVGTEDFAGTCTPGQVAEPQDRTRDSNIYGSLIRDRLRLYAPTPTKPLRGLPRTYPVGLTNRNSVERTYRLVIANQPCADETICRASWRQRPSGPLFVADTDPAWVPPTLVEDLTIPAASTLARTLFVVGASDDDEVTVQVYDADVCDGGVEPCEVLTSVTLGGTNTGTSGALQQPDYQNSPVCLTDSEGNPLTEEERTACFSNLENELHNPELLNPELANPELLNPELANPELANPELLNPELANPELLNPELLNPELANLGFQNPELANPELLNPELANPELLNPELANPELLNPELANPELANPELANSTVGDGTTWTDYTYVIRNTGNVTTAFNADLALSGPDAGNVDSQLIAYTIHLVPTSRDCRYVAQYEKQVLATVNNPDDDLDVADIDNPFNGGISALAEPGQSIFFARRVFGTPSELANVTVSGFTASSQAANCRETNPDDIAEKDYICEESLVTDQELILLDTAPPLFDNVPIGTFEIAAEDAQGACTDLVGTLGITASDNGEPVAVSCQVSEPPDLCALPGPDEQVPLGPSLVTCTATDGAGNEASIQIPVEVTDQDAPTLTTLQASVSIDLAPGAGTETVVFEDNVTAADNVDAGAAISIFCQTDDAPPLVSGDPLAPGSYQVTCSATDSAGNVSADVGYTLTINDVTPPVFDAASLVTVSEEATSASGATVTYALPTATDAADPSPVVSCAPASGTLFAIGTTTVDCTATDATGNVANASFDVTVADTTVPTITLNGPAIQEVEAATAYVELGATASDFTAGDLDGSIVIDAGAVDVFTVGDYLVTYDVTDGAGNTAQVTRTVQVRDNTAPVISLIGDDPLIIEAGDGYFEPGALANDTLDGNISAAIVIDASAVQPNTPGSYLVYYNVSDSTGNAAAAVTRVVNVIDTTAPAFSGLPLPNVTVPADGVTGAIVTYATPTVTDAGDPAPTVICTPASGSLFPIGTTAVTCTATDLSGNSASAGFSVIVQDNIDPVITVPGPVTAPAESTLGATVNYVVTVTDNADPAPALSCAPPSGSFFAFGTTTVNCTATDASGNTATASFTVTVQYGAPYGIEFSKGKIQAGSSVPLTFGWRNAAGNLMDSSAAQPLVTARDCATGLIVLNPGEFPGNSDLRWEASQNTWKFNWQTVFMDGTPLPATKQGTNYCLRVISNRTGQAIPATGFTIVTLKN